MIAAGRNGADSNPWKDAFGDAWSARNAVKPEWVKSRVRWLRRALERVRLGPRSTVLEVGASTGLNLLALSRLTDARLFGSDLNHAACRGLQEDRTLARRHARAAVADALRLPYKDGAADLVMTCALLIHIPPERLQDACAELVRVSKRYLLVAEYFSHEPEEVEYRGRKGLLFKRDFGGFLLDHFRLEALDYGFLWGRAEPSFDDVHWWLFKKI